VPAADWCPLFSPWLLSEGGPHFVALLALPCSASLQYYCLSGRLVSREGSVHPPDGCAYLTPAHPTGSFPAPGRAAAAPWPEVFGRQGYLSRACPTVHCLTSQPSWKRKRGCSGFLLGLAVPPQVPGCRLRPSWVCAALMKERHTGSRLPDIPHHAHICTQNRTLFSSPGL